LTAKEGITAVTARPAFLDGRRGKGGNAMMKDVKRHSKLVGKIDDFGSKQLNRLQGKVMRRGSWQLNRMGASQAGGGGIAKKYGLGGGSARGVQEEHRITRTPSPDLNDDWERLTGDRTGYLQRCGMHTIASAASHSTKFVAVHKDEIEAANYDR